jgi:hypothetical protein
MESSTSNERRCRDRAGVDNSIPRALVTATFWDDKDGEANSDFVSNCSAIYDRRHREQVVGMVAARFVDGIDEKTYKTITFHCDEGEESKVKEVALQTLLDRVTLLRKMTIEIAERMTRIDEREGARGLTIDFVTSS